MDKYNGNRSKSNRSVVAFNDPVTHGTQSAGGGHQFFDLKNHLFGLDSKTFPELGFVGTFFGEIVLNSQMGGDTMRKGRASMIGTYAPIKFKFGVSVLNQAH